MLYIATRGKPKQISVKGPAYVSSPVWWAVSDSSSSLTSTFLTRHSFYLCRLQVIPSFLVPYLATIRLKLPEKFQPSDFQEALTTLNIASTRAATQIEVHNRSCTCTF